MPSAESGDGMPSAIIRNFTLILEFIYFNLRLITSLACNSMSLNVGEVVVGVTVFRVI